MPVQPQNTEVKERLGDFFLALNTALSQKLMDLSEEFMTDYSRFIHVLDYLNKYTENLYKKDELDQYPEYTLKNHAELIKTYQESEKLLNKVKEDIAGNPELNSILGDLLSKTGDLLSKDINTLSKVHPEQGRSLAESIDHGRCICVDVGDKELSKVGARSNQRYAMTVDLNGEEKKGFFTKSKQLKPLDGALLKSYAETAINEAVKNGAENSGILQNFKKPLLKAVESLDGISTKDFESFALVEAIQKLGPEYPDDNLVENADELAYQMTLAMRNIPEASDYIESHELTTKQYREVILADENTDITGRNVAMSRMADLMGISDIIAESQPMEILNAEGQIEKGIFMANAKGVDREKITDDTIKGWTPESGERSLKNENLIKSIANMQILDYICGNVDRHQSNIFYQFNEDGSELIGIQGIDNDFSFGKASPEMAKAVSAVALLLEDLKVIPEELSQRLDAMDESMVKLTLRDTGLTESEMDAAMQRLNQVKEAIANKTITTVKKDEWKDFDIKKLSGEPVDTHRNHFTTVGMQIDCMKQIAKENAEEQKEEQLQDDNEKAPFTFQKVETLDPLDRKILNIGLRQQEEQEKQIEASQRAIVGSGSKEFKKMREAGQQFHEAMETYMADHSKEHYDQVQSMLDRMKKNAQDYLGKKNPNTKNEKTKTRIKIAKDVSKFADEQKKVLEEAVKKHEEMEKQKEKKTENNVMKL